VSCCEQNCNKHRSTTLQNMVGAIATIATLLTVVGKRCANQRGWPLACPVQTLVRVCG
jgi:hypothetical protein